MDRRPFFACTILTTLFFWIVVTTSTAHSFPGSDDEVYTLPGVNFPIPFRHYSGYLDSLNQSQLHYWFFESQNNPSTDPVLLWLNGGPGCSSLLGALTEQGPIRINPDGSLTPNPYAWNLRTNIIFLESPAGTGFSYKIDSNDYNTDDRQVEQIHYQAVKSFFHKFPHFLSNDFYVTGEGYAGIYVTGLLFYVVQNQFPPNIRGFAIGNGHFDSIIGGNSILQFGYYHGLYGTSARAEMVKQCCSSVNMTDLECDFVSNGLKKCGIQVWNVRQELFNAPINVCNIYELCRLPSNNVTSATVSRESIQRRYMFSRLLKTNFDKSSSSEVICNDESYVENWLNQKSVREALNIRPESLKWVACSEEVFQTYIFDWEWIPPIHYLLQNGLKGLLYYGDVNMVSNFLGGQWFADSLGLKVVKDYFSWQVNQQLAGYAKVYENFTYTTVRGAGCIVPSDRPAEALELLHKFLDDTWITDN